MYLRLLCLSRGYFMRPCDTCRKEPRRSGSGTPAEMTDARVWAWRLHCWQRFIARVNCDEIVRIGMLPLVPIGS